VVVGLESPLMLDRELVKEVLAAARVRGGALSELFVEERVSTSIRLDDGKIEELTTGADRGAGVRVAEGTTYGYAFSNRLDRDALMRAAEAAAASFTGHAAGVVDFTERKPSVVHRAERPGQDVPAAEKVAWLHEVDDAARSFSSEVRQVSAIYGDSVQHVLIATSDGRWVREDRPRIRLYATVVAARDGVIQTGAHGPAALAGAEFFKRKPPREAAEIAARRAVTMLDSIPAPAGEMAVVLGPGCGGVLFHEAVGHPLEADIVDKEASVYRDRIGETLASPLVNGVDDATLANEWGSFSFDDEGTPSERTVLFDQGVLRGMLFDRLRAEKIDGASTGNGRRQSYASPPIPRMTNTYILNGGSKPQDVISSTDGGVYVTALAGGQVNPATGDFVFGCSEAFLIEKGKVTTPVRGANLIGQAIPVMSAVDAVADDFDTWEGTCGKDGQMVPVGSGSPTLRISRLTVGGTGA
jgi:TldD protein